MRLREQISNLQRRRNKRQSNGSMLKMVTSEVTINLNMFGTFMKD
jgi:hypothetical protein